MIPDSALNEMLSVQLLGTNASGSTSDNVFAAFQRLAAHTKNWLTTNQLQRARQCFELVNSCYGKCSAKAQMAIETAFLFSISCCLDGLANGEEARELLPDTLRELCIAHRLARDI